MNEDEIKLREYLIILNEENPTHKRENVNFSIINLFEKQQKEIEKLKSRKYVFNAETNEVKEIPISDDYINKDKIRHIRDKAECMDYYNLNDVIDDLSKLLGDEI